MSMLVCGVDEAGRGPVIGPLVICGVMANAVDEHLLYSVGVKDSKELTAKQRLVLFEKIKKVIQNYKVIIISPQDVDKALSSKKSNLNWLEAVKTAEIINKLKPDKAILDCPSPNIKAYKKYLEKHLKRKVELVVSHKADQLYPIVSAASIIAKVIRDNEIEKIKKKIGIEFGSGYPSDPLTAEFLKENYKKYPKIFRKNWASYKETLKKKGQKSLSEF